MGAFKAKRRHRDDDGATIVEFIAVIPVVLFVFFAIMELGWLGYAFAETWSSAREGARQATTVTSTGPVDRLADCTSVQDAVRGRVALRDLPNSAITVEYYQDTDGDGTPELVADCDTGTTGTPEPTKLGCTVPAGNAPIVCNGNDLIGITVEVTVTETYDALPVPFLGNIFDGAPLTSTQVRSIQSGVIFGGNS